jgi:6-hydroxy-3-succinoylpyridine 3-monooxygenase
MPGDPGLEVEEKQSDVNLALQAYHDAITGQIVHAVIVTNDTDIAPALEMIRTHTQVLIGVVVPTTDDTRAPNTDLVKLAHWKRQHISATKCLPVATRHSGQKTGRQARVLVRAT